MPSTARNKTFLLLLSVARSLKPFGSILPVSKRDVSTENRVELEEGKETKVKHSMPLLFVEFNHWFSSTACF